MATLLAPLIDAEAAVLKALHSVGLGWGLAIVGLTVLVRLTLLPIVARQVRAQRELRRHLPELARLRERHRDDRERLQRELLDYYRRHGINPLASLAPTLLQIPVFISLYFLMREEVRDGLFAHAGFLFIPDLGARAHGTVLLVLVATYAVAQLASSAVAATALDGGQRGFVMALPLLFAGVVARVPAGLAVYWITSALWSFGQQLTVRRLLGREPATALAGAATSSGSAGVPTSGSGGSAATSTRKPPPRTGKRKRRRRAA